MRQETDSRVLSLAPRITTIAPSPIANSVTRPTRIFRLLVFIFLQSPYRQRHWLSFEFPVGRTSATLRLFRPPHHDTGYQQPESNAAGYKINETDNLTAYSPEMQTIVHVHVIGEGLP